MTGAATILERGTARSNYPLMPSDSQAAPLFLTRESERVMEEWRDIPGYEDIYQASDLGAIRRKYNKRNFKAPVNSHGYRVCTLIKGGVKKTFNVHTLVAVTFLGPANGLYVDHINFDKTDNRLRNLQYVTPRENTVRSMKKTDGLPVGVRKRKNRFVASFSENGKQVELGYFKTIKEASDAYEYALENGQKTARAKFRKRF